ncbi:Mycothiol acetyltransferase [Arthrobacter saudimassiliensis]|uniref:Mycothiol acetyltransferase n=1 Tax=Arthrobacter saudimassiliensis TaxID=1461584 RepID=A0A078MX70_9MICC|nr:Mycothiol acetyltransferase [Arthrobacter saudimassiliensis]
MENDTLQLRTATLTDDAELARMNASAWTPEIEVVPAEGPDKPFFADYRRVEDVIVAADGDTLAGFAHLARHIRIPKNDHVLHLNSLVVAPGQRGRGISHRLVDAAVEEARRRGARKLGLRALSTNKVAVELYRQHGFVEEGRLREEFRQPDGGWADDVWMALFL